ncbi:hypothetical protein HY029_05765 [Candidatus Gottesmanbacteria bacterium]|nr:hypothetical protein [Candidatus Gottesmanbacteria bacterium]
MLLNLVFLFLLLFFLFLLSRKISIVIYRSSYLITKNRNLSVGILTTIILPGTIIHELGHFFMATILRVPTGELTIIPTIEKNGDIKAGKLILASVDPIRQILIGLAPMIIGLIIVYFIGKFFLSNITLSTINNHLLSILLGLYLLFITSITMFSSKKDLESLVVVGPLTLIIATSLYITGVRVYFEKSLTGKISSILSAVDFYLLIAILISITIYFLLYTNLSLWQKILRRKIS